MAFYVGQKVVCVNGTQANMSKLKWACILRNNGLKRGTIYTVSAVGLIHPADPDELPCITVYELPPFPVWQHRFRPVVEKKTDISQLVEIARKASRKQREPA